MLAVRTGPIIGLIIQVILLTILATVLGLGVVGWATGVTYGLVTAAALSYGLHRTGALALGPANRVTLARATLVGCVAALTAESFRAQPPVRLLVAITIAALALDAVDGRVARRTHTVSGLGARFDMEIDAFLVLALSVYVAQSVGAWVLTIGAMRYAFLAAGRILPWLRGPLPSRLWGKTIAAIQGIVLVVAAAGMLLRPVAVTALVVSLALLVGSFGHSVSWLWRHRAGLPAPASQAVTSGRARTAPDPIDVRPHRTFVPEQLVDADAEPR